MSPAVEHNWFKMEGSSNPTDRAIGWKCFNPGCGVHVRSPDKPNPADGGPCPDIACDCFDCQKEASAP